MNLNVNRGGPSPRGRRAAASPIACGTCAAGTYYSYPRCKWCPSKGQLDAYAIVSSVILVGALVSLGRYLGGSPREGAVARLARVRWLRWLQTLATPPGLRRASTNLKVLIGYCQLLRTFRVFMLVRWPAVPLTRTSSLPRRTPCPCRRRRVYVYTTWVEMALTPGHGTRASGLPCCGTMVLSQLVGLAVSGLPRLSP